ncbi:MAG: lipocalin family protein, partial [Planctomycetota bacterium JB042]
AVVAGARPPAGNDDRWEVRRRGDGFRVRARDDAKGASFDLALAPRRPHVFQGPNGYSAKSADGSAASLYYSFTRLATDGTVTFDGRTFEVAGESWMDREWSSSQLGEVQVGWDWFALRLDDGRDLMLYVLRRADGSLDHARGTLVGADGAVAWIGPEAWTIDPTSTWTSAATGATYPSRWRVAVPSAELDVEVRPLVEAQENVSAILRRLHYWEGAVEVVRDGTRIGEGYVELTGYGDDARLPLRPTDEP